VSRRTLFVLIVAGLVGFAALVVSYELDSLAAADRETAEWVAASMPSWIQSLARVPSWIGGWLGITALAIVLGVVLVRERAWLDLGFLLAALAGSQIVVSLLKEWFDRPRPNVGSAVALPSSASFPSGHATAGVASLGAAAVLIAERLPSHRMRVWLWTVVVIGGLAVGVSRVVLNVHYVTDVVAGWCLGLAWLAACLLVRESIRGRASSTADPGTLLE
jgi:undecaprenyl-diphosphatase